MSLYYDGCFPDAPLILTEEEYFDKVIFDQELLQPFSHFFHWIINDKQGYIQNGEFKENFKWALIYERVKNDDDNGNDDAFAFNFGDLLVYLPVNERLEWKQFFQRTDINIDRQDKLLLLFYDDKNNNDHDSDLELVGKYWASRIENLQDTEDLPWWTKRQKEQALQDLHDLKQVDQETGQWKDLTWLDFRPQVLDKYRNNELCEIGNDHISFLRHDKKTSASDANFIIKNNDNDVLMMYAKDFNNVPPMERNYWNHYQIKQTATR
jgi:hypothetical protein